jgi:hypothetical protein
MTIRSFTLNVVAPPAGAEADWVYRSTGPGVVWAHNFEQAAEVSNFLYTSDGAYPYQNTDPMACQRIAAPEFGAGAGAISARTYTARLIDGLPAVPKGTVATIRVSDASPFIDPTTYYNRWYLLLVGFATNEQQYWGYPQELVRVDAVDYVNNTLTVRRGHQTYSGATEAPAHIANTPIGTTDKMRWNRPMCPLVAGSNGKTTDDIGIQNGYRTRPWAWSRTGHGRFRGGYWGHETTYGLFNPLWPPADDYSVGNRGATYGYEGPTAAIPQITNSFAHADPQMCNEYWIQWRQYMPALKAQDSASKLCYLQNVDRSTAQQLFLGVDNRSRPNLPGAPGGTGPQVSFAHNFGAEIEDWAQGDGQPMDTLIDYNHWLDTWATFMIHVKCGRGQREWSAYPNDGRGGAPESIIELYCAGPSDSGFTKIKSIDTFRMRYGYPGNYIWNPPAYNSFAPVNYPNAYISPTSSSGAPLTNHEMKFAQVILSRHQIPCPAPLV